jgi:hypothetical protein
MIQKWFYRWIALRAFNALYMYHDTMSNRSSEAGNKVIEVLDIIRGDIHERKD